MSLYKKIRSLGVADDAKVNFSTKMAATFSTLTRLTLKQLWAKPILLILLPRLSPKVSWP